MKHQFAASLFAIAPAVVAGYDLETSLNKRLSSLRHKGNTKQTERKLNQIVSNGLEAAQTFFVPLPEDVLFDDTFKAVNSNAQNGTESLISISISTDGSKVYYDHWEDGYEDDPMRPIQESTEIWGDGDHTNGCRPDIACTAENALLDVLDSGDSVVLENLVPLDHGAGTTFLYDGRDRIQALYPIAITRGAYPSFPGSFNAGAVEVFDTNHWGTTYKIPLAQGTNSAHDAFEYVALYIMASEDGTILSDGNGDAIQTLNKGESYFKVVESTERGSEINANNKVQVNMVTGDRDSSYELRWFSLRPHEEWSNSYLSPVGDTKAMTKVLVYNPSDTTLEVTYKTNTGTFTLDVPGNDVKYTETIVDGSACKLTASEPFVAFSISDTEEGEGDNHDWGFPVLSTDMLTSMALIGWGYGCTQNECDYFFNGNARSVVWVSPISDATIYVDYENDGDIDGAYDVDDLNSEMISNPNGSNDMSGAVIWATERGTGPSGPQVAIAAAWGQYAGGTFGGDIDALDLGTVVVPFTPIAATKTLVLTNDVHNDGVVGYSDTVRYEIEVVNIGPSDIGDGLITIEDIIDPNVEYVPGSTFYVDHDGNSISISDDTSGTPFPLDEGGIQSQALLPRGGVHYIKFSVVITNDPNVAIIVNTGVASVWDNKARFENRFPLGGEPKSEDIVEDDPLLC